MKTNIVIVTLVGLPGAGKTTLCQKLVEYLNTQPSMKFIHSIHICYDDLIPLSQQERFAKLKQRENLNSNDHSNWKSARQDIYSKIDKLLDRLDNNDQDVSYLYNALLDSELIRFDSTSVINNDPVISNNVAPVPSLLNEDSAPVASNNAYVPIISSDKHISSDITCIPTNIAPVFSTIPSHPTLVRETKPLYVLLLDDNFYYRSMRYEHYKLARKHGTGFCQVYVECNTDVALEHNMQRINKVPEEVVRAMAEKLQPPCPAQHSWEAATYIAQFKIEPIEAELRAELNSRFVLEDLAKIWEMICQCSLSPVLPVEDNSTRITESRIQCSKNVAHQADLKLRAIVGNLIRKSHSKTMDAKKQTRAPSHQANATTVSCLQGTNTTIDSFSHSTNTAALAQQFNMARQKILKEIQNGTLCFPPHLAHEIVQENVEEFKEFLNSELQQIITKGCGE